MVSLILSDVRVATNIHKATSTTNALTMASMVIVYLCNVFASGTHYRLSRGIVALPTPPAAVFNNYKMSQTRKVAVLSYLEK